MTNLTERNARYIVWCETCYQCHIGYTNSKKQANIIAVSHMNQWHHDVHIRDRKEKKK